MKRTLAERDIALVRIARRAALGAIVALPAIAHAQPSRNERCRAADADRTDVVGRGGTGDSDCRDPWGGERAYGSDAGPQDPPHSRPRGRVACSDSDPTDAAGRGRSCNPPAADGPH